MPNLKPPLVMISRPSSCQQCRWNNWNGFIVKPLERLTFQKRAVCRFDCICKCCESSNGMCHGDDQRWRILLKELLEGKDGRPEHFGSIFSFEFESDGVAALLGGTVMADEPCDIQSQLLPIPCMNAFAWPACLLSDKTEPNRCSNSFGPFIS
jgi:hypothetical protein